MIKHGGGTPLFLYSDKMPEFTVFYRKEHLRCVTGLLKLVSFFY